MYVFVSGVEEEKGGEREGRMSYLCGTGEVGGVAVDHAWLIGVVCVCGGRGGRVCVGVGHGGFGPLYCFTSVLGGGRGGGQMEMKEGTGTSE